MKAEQELLQGVSRSFALTIPQLPNPLDREVTSGYLLCRILDTIEDESALSLSQKENFFNHFVDVVNGRILPENFSTALYPLLGPVTPDPEKELIQSAPSVIQNFSEFASPQKASMIRCVTKMASGMLEYQGVEKTFGLETLGMLSGYCYYVAGVVGEMLTDLFCLYDDAIADQRDDLFPLAQPFGQGLQMTNILKDLWEDRERGVCWLPQDVFNAFGFDLKNLGKTCYSAGFGSGLLFLIGLTNRFLQDAVDYTLAIPRNQVGIRRFCLWAIGMAVFTLKNIRKNLQYTSAKEIKITRKTVYFIMGVSDKILRSNILVRLFHRWSIIGLPTRRYEYTDIFGRNSRTDQYAARL